MENLTLYCKKFTEAGAERHLASYSPLRTSITIVFGALLSFTVLNDMIGGFGFLNNAGHLPTILIIGAYIALIFIGAVRLRLKALIAFAMIVMLLSALALFSPDQSRRAFVVVMNLLLAFSIYEVIKRIGIHREAILFFILPVLFITCYIIYLYGSYSGGRLMVSDYSNPTHLAGYLCAFLFFCIPLIGRDGQATNMAVIFLFLFVVFLLLLTQGRNAILVLVVSFVASYFIKSMIERNIRTTLTLLSISLVFMLIVLNLETLLVEFSILLESLGVEGARTHRLLMLANLGEEDVTAGRTHRWVSILTNFEGIGLYGLGNAAEIIGSSPHNMYLTAFVEGTVLFLLAYVSVLLRILGMQIKKRRWELVPAAFFLILLGFGNDVLYYKYWWLTVFVIAFWAGYYEHEKRYGQK